MQGITNTLNTRNSHKFDISNTTIYYQINHNHCSLCLLFSSFPFFSIFEQ